MSDLVLALKGEYFDAIRDGSKTEEFRIMSPYWARRLHDNGRQREYDRVVLTRGYPKGGGVEGITRLTRAWCGFDTRSITHPHFGPDPVPVYAIDVSEPWS